jgi:hypothetical protein
MDNVVTVDQAIEAGIAAEQAMEALFRGLESKFTPYPDLVTFWKNYGQDEVMHARWLIAVRARLDPEQLAAPVPEAIVASMREVADFSMEGALGQVKNLEQAYALVKDIESGETNAIFRFILNHFAPDEHTAHFLQTELNTHILRLATSLPSQYQSSAMQRAITTVS